MRYLSKKPFTANLGNPAAYREGWEATFGRLPQEDHQNQTNQQSVPFDIDLATTIFMDDLIKSGSDSETDFSMDKDDHYKPFYRAIVCLVAPGRVRDEIFGGRMPTFYEAQSILKRAHPYFAKAMEEDPETFNMLWENHVEVWQDT